jgi:glucosamine 6-phosphate synthetase-like amidotransferase/phosphosugar isomerase protein
VDYLYGGVGCLAPDILTLPLAPPSRTQEYTLRAARVTQAVNTTRFAILDKGDPNELAALAEVVLRVPVTNPFFKPIFYILPGQMIPCYTKVTRPVGKPEAQRTNFPCNVHAFDITMLHKSH